MNKILTNPFEKYTENKLILIGSLATIIFSYVAFLSSYRLNALLDIHLSDNITIYQPLVDNIINVFTCSIILYLLGLYINNKTRYIDILTISLVSRIPLYPLLIINMEGILEDLAPYTKGHINPENIEQIDPTSFVWIIIFSLCAIGALIWYMILLYNGFKISTNSKGKKPVALFIISILLLEFLTYQLIKVLNY